METFKTVQQVIFLILALISLYRFHKGHSEWDLSEMIYGGISLILFYLFIVNA